MFLLQARYILHTLSYFKYKVKYNLYLTSKKIPAMSGLFLKKTTDHLKCNIHNDVGCHMAGSSICDINNCTEEVRVDLSYKVITPKDIRKL